MTVRRLLLALVLSAFLAGCGSDSSDRGRPGGAALFGTIGVTYDGQLWLLAADGSSERQVSFGSDWAGQAALSADGRRVVFDTSNGIWTVPVAGGRAKLVPGLPVALNRPNFDAAWAPDGRSLVFAGEDGIYTVDPSMKTTARLLFRDPTATRPVWSGDGGSIAFVRGHAARRGRQSIWVVRSDGSRPRFLVHGDDPAFSPDGKSIAYSGAAGVYLLRLGGGRPHLLADHGYQPVWSPDGRHIAFKRQTKRCNDASCYERVWIATRAGSPVAMLEPDLLESGGMTWTQPAPSDLEAISVPD